jgi:hypothetical protein
MPTPILRAHYDTFWQRVFGYHPDGSMVTDGSKRSSKVLDEDKANGLLPDNIVSTNLGTFRDWGSKASMLAVQPGRRDSIDGVVSLGEAERLISYWELTIEKLQNLCQQRGIKREGKSWRECVGGTGSRANIIAALTKYDEQFQTGPIVELRELVGPAAIVKADTAAVSVDLSPRTGSTLDNERLPKRTLPVQAPSPVAFDLATPEGESPFAFNLATPETWRTAKLPAGRLRMTPFDSGRMYEYDGDAGTAEYQLDTPMVQALQVEQVKAMRADDLIKAELPMQQKQLQANQQSQATFAAELMRSMIWNAKADAGGSPHATLLEAMRCANLAIANAWSELIGARELTVAPQARDDAPQAARDDAPQAAPVATESQSGQSPSEARYDRAGCETPKVPRLEAGTRLHVWWPGEDDPYECTVLECVLSACIDTGAQVHYLHRCQYANGVVEHDLSTLRYERLGADKRGNGRTFNGQLPIGPPSRPSAVKAKPLDEHRRGIFPRHRHGLHVFPGRLPRPSR